MVSDLINQCDKDDQKELALNITLNGGTTLFKNFDARLKNDLQSEFPNLQIEIAGEQDIFSDNTDAYFMSKILRNWKGAMVMSHFPEFQKRMIDRDTYFENGVHR